MEGQPLSLLASYRGGALTCTWRRQRLYLVPGAQGYEVIIAGRIYM